MNIRTCLIILALIAISVTIAFIASALSIQNASLNIRATIEQYLSIELIITLSLLISLIFFNLGLYKGKRLNIALEKRLLERSQTLSLINKQLFNEINKNKKTAQLLKSTQNYLQNIINSMPFVLIGIDKDKNITHWNKVATDNYGMNHSAAIGQNLDKIKLGLTIDQEALKKAFESQEIQQQNNKKVEIKDDTKFYDITIYPLEKNINTDAVILIEDVTAKITVETMMIQNERLTFLGQLAAGVAHEINNPVSIILQNLQNIKRRFSNELDGNLKAAKKVGIEIEALHQYLEERKINELIDEIYNAGEQTASIVKNMLRFSRSDNSYSEDNNLKDIIETSLSLAKQNLALLNQTKSININLNTRFPDHIPSIHCSEIDIQQVVLNMVNNAFQAFDQNIANAWVNITLEFNSDEAFITVEDNGKGMNAWTLKHIFDPFFTTKDINQGTGLGLSISYFIVTERHKGKIEAFSREGEGTRFVIRLPR